MHLQSRKIYLTALTTELSRVSSGSMQSSISLKLWCSVTTSSRCTCTSLMLKILKLKSSTLSQKQTRMVSIHCLSGSYYSMRCILPWRLKVMRRGNQQDVPVRRLLLLARRLNTIMIKVIFFTKRRHTQIGRLSRVIQSHSAMESLSAKESRDTLWFSSEFVVSPSPPPHIL